MAFLPTAQLVWRLTSYKIVLPTLYNTDLMIMLAAMAVDVGMMSCGFVS